MSIENISFVIITLNEEYAIKKSLSAISRMPLRNCEVICVDSGSSDKTLEGMLSFRGNINNLYIYQLNGDANSAIARNIGIKNARKKYIFFVDGDTEVELDFVYLAISKMENEEYAAIAGDLVEYQYSPTYKKILRRIESRSSILQEKDIYYSGGNFIAKRDAIDDIGFFDENLINNQDWDYTLRLSSRYKMVAIPIIMGTHHTIPYDDKNRIREAIAKKYASYFGKTIRKNIKNNLKGVLFALKKQTGYTVGVLFYLLLPFVIIFFKTTLFVLIPAIIIADFIYGMIQKKDIYHRLVSHFIEPLFVIKGFLFIKNKKLNYKVMKVYPCEILQ
jgi:glycosyltransferase involved in cell wall biosynthesis